MKSEKTAEDQRLIDAFRFAFRLHRQDLRKGTEVPYMAHLLGVCALVLSDGGTEDEAIAALLHDSLEDHPKETSREEIAAFFGHRVLAIVEACSEPGRFYNDGRKRPWRERKSAYLDHLGRTQPWQRRVALADKLDNARALLADYRQEGDGLWDRFNAGRNDQLWFFRSVVESLRQAGETSKMLDELDRVVSELERIALPVQEEKKPVNMG